MGVDFTGIELPFGAGELLSSVFGFVGVLAPFILLGLAIVFTPRIVSVIRNSASSKGGRN